MRATYQRFAALRRVVAGVLAIPGVLAVAAGAFVLIDALRIAPLDPHHGASTLMLGAILLTGIGVVLIVLALFVRPRQEPRRRTAAEQSGQPSER